jgi:hypothetical protein
VDQDLLDWLKDVRKSKKQGRLDPQYVRQLEKLGFVWDPIKQYQKNFYAALLDYRKRYGDCRVPYKWPKNRSLASWVSRMRTAKRKNLLPKAKIRELDQIGFAWSIDPRSAWQQRFKELERFKKKHGHCNVPKNCTLNVALSRWVSRTRQRKKLGKLAKDRIRHLTALGFCWDMGKGKKPLRKPGGRNPTQKPKKPAAKLRKDRS